MSKKRVVAALATLCAAYLIWPYVTLYRLAAAIRQGDAATLERLVDWEGVREGIKEDICDNLFDEPQTQVASGEHLPPFGFSFVRGIAANVVDANVTPQALVTAVKQAPSTGRERSGPERNPAVAWAFFDTPDSFSVLLRPPAESNDAPIRIQLELRHGTWKVTRAWLPREMLIQANSRT